MGVTKIAIASAVGLFFALFLAVTHNFATGGVYVLAALSVIGVSLIFASLKDRRLLKLEFTWKGILIGVALFGVFLLINLLQGQIAIGIPEFQSLGETGEFLTVGVVAPLLEELLFKYALFGILTVLIGVGTIAAVIITSFAFMIFHLVAYGGDLLLASGLLLGAFIFSLLSFVAVFLADRNILPAEIAHNMINVFLFLKKAGVIQ